MGKRLKGMQSGETPKQYAKRLDKELSRIDQGGKVKCALSTKFLKHTKGGKPSRKKPKFTC